MIEILGNGFLDNGKFVDWSKGRSPQWHQAVQNRQNYWGKWSANNGPKLANFQQNRNQNWANVHNFWNNRSPSATFNKPEWNNYRNQVHAFRDNRNIEINNNIQNHFDNNFDDHWWGNCGWYNGPVVVSNGNPWWWWGAATVATVGTFLALDAIHEANRPPPPAPVYDYGVNVVYQGKEVYVNGKPAASTTEYARQASTLADSAPADVPAPMPPQQGKTAEWLPLGVWALAQEKEGDAYMFFQISVDKDGVVSGAYKNVLSGEQAPISGRVDKKTQRVAWKIGNNSDTTIETGVQNLTQDVTSCLVHFGEETAQTWLLVRLKQPELPNAPETAPAEQGKTAGP
ncbi:MAG: mu-protocadherin-cell-suface protein [Verrucomicrobia bacterium]|nr:mu-protocadherin-cell-suface protein [Verrucomicrobiota bacterium]